MYDKTYPLGAEMRTVDGIGNNGTIEDWLGTSATAARVAALCMEEVRSGESVDAVRSVSRAIGQLEQALDEAKAVHTQAAHERAYRVGE